jgi:hypothetical protein
MAEPVDAEEIQRRRAEIGDRHNRTNMDRQKGMADTVEK